MTNLDIITTEAIANGLYSQEEVEAIYAEGRELPLHTFAGWRARGYKVKKGEHARITTKLWKMKRGKETLKDKDGNEVEEETKNMYLCKSFLFTGEQVEMMDA